MMLNNCSKYYRNVDKICVVARTWHVRPLSAQAQAEVKPEQDLEWKNAKPFSAIPGMSQFEILRAFLPGGKFHDMHILDVNKIVFKEYGKIMKFPALFGKPAMIFMFDPKDIEAVFRNEGQWPIRRGIDTFEYYRQKVRPEIFKNVGGLVNDQGEAWSKMRSAVNPIMMKPKVVKAYIPDIDVVAREFIRRVVTLRDDNNEMPDDFQNELNKWSLESIALIALEHRLGLINNENDPEGQSMITAVKDFFQLSYELDVQPSIWKYVETPTFKKLMTALDVMTNISKKHVDRAIEQMEQETEAGKIEGGHEDSVLKKILRIDKQFALVMALDMLMAGIDTTASASAGLLYNLAKNQQAQDKLREEIMALLPTADTPLTPESLNSLPYMRACIKESMRVTPVVAGNVRCAGRDMVLQGYQIPKGTDCVMGTVTLQQNEVFVDRSSEFIPERFLKEVQAGCPNAKDINPFILLPFGFGARACIGRRFAEMEIEVLMIRLLREYKVEWNYGPLEFAKALIITPSTKLKFKITKI